jgi:membrane-bound lytic murein transglycosylase D
MPFKATIVGMRNSIALTVFIFLLLVTPAFAFNDIYSQQLMNVGVFTPEPIEVCRPGTIIIDSFEPIGICMKDEFVMPEDDYIVPVSLDLTSYRHHRRATRAVERNIELYTGRLKETFATYLSRSGRYIGMMKNILREEGLPEDMAYLPLVESGFNTRAYSRRRAAGPWQFISATAKRYGLKVNWWVDERRDPVKSTRAAARYLSDLYDMFGSWSLAMAAYNAGETRIRKALRRTRSHDYWGLLSTRHIKRETKNYVPNFIAARLIAANPVKYGFDIKYEEAFVYDEVRLESPLTLDIIAKCANTTVRKIKEMNPELRRWSTPPNVKNYRVKIPRGMHKKFFKNLMKIPEGKRFTVKVYRVKRGDTVSEIAEKTGVRSKTIISYNKLNRRGFITVGQKLLIPIGLRVN